MESDTRRPSIPVGADAESQRNPTDGAARLASNLTVIHAHVVDTRIGDLFDAADALTRARTTSAGRRFGTLARSRCASGRRWAAGGDPRQDDRLHYHGHFPVR